MLGLKSDIRMEYKIGDNIEPWGTPARMVLSVKAKSSTLTLNNLGNKKTFYYFLKVYRVIECVKFKY